MLSLKSKRKGKGRKNSHTYIYIMSEWMLLSFRLFLLPWIGEILKCDLQIVKLILHSCHVSSRNTCKLYLQVLYFEREKSSVIGCMFKAEMANSTGINATSLTVVTLWCPATPNLSTPYGSQERSCDQFSLHNVEWSGVCNSTASVILLLLSSLSISWMLMATFKAIGWRE